MATLAAVAVVFAILAGVFHVPLAAAAAFPFFLALVILVIVAGTGRRDQLTAYGTQLAARLAGEGAALVSAAAPQDMTNSPDAELGRRAVAVAAMVPGAGPGLSTPGRRRGAAGQTEAWSVFSGTWRLVRIEPQLPQRTFYRGTVTLAYATFSR